MKEWYSITELAEKTEIPEPTLRRYINKFQPYFISKGGSRAKKYDPSAIDILKRIKKLFDAGYETAGVAEVIRHEFPVITNDNNDSEIAGNPLVPTLATSDDVMEIKQALAEQREFNKLLLQKLADQERFIKESLEQRDQVLLEKLAEKEQGKVTEEESATPPVAKTEEPKKGFFKRFFK